MDMNKLKDRSEQELQEAENALVKYAEHAAKLIPTINQYLELNKKTANDKNMDNDMMEALLDLSKPIAMIQNGISDSIGLMGTALAMKHVYDDKKFDEAINTIYGFNKLIKEMEPKIIALDKWARERMDKEIKDAEKEKTSVE